MVSGTPALWMMELRRDGTSVGADGVRFRPFPVLSELQQLPNLPKFPDEQGLDNHGSIGLR